jgi:hypothetical protein
VPNMQVALSRVCKTLAFVLFASLLAVPQARSEGASLSGSWSGGGIVVYSSGERERARCTAQYSDSGSRVSLTATCATPSGTVTQSAVLRKTGPNTYSGTFHNAQFNVSGSIYVVVHGSTQSVTLRSGSGSASLTLRH